MEKLKRNSEDWAVYVEVILNQLTENEERLMSKIHELEDRITEIEQRISAQEMR